MRKAIKVLLCGLFLLGFIGLIDAHSLRAEDSVWDSNFEIDLDGDGKYDIIAYSYTIKKVDEDTTKYNFKITVNGKKVYSEKATIEAFPEETKDHKLHDELYGLGDVKVELIDINPSDKYKEIALSYYFFEDSVILGLKVLRFKNGKMKVIAEDYTNLGSNFYIPYEQKNNKYITINDSVFIPAFGTVWLTKNYKISKKGLTEKKPKSNIYNVAAPFFELNDETEFTVAKDTKVYSDVKLKKCVDEIYETDTIVLKKIKFNGTEYDSFLAYVDPNLGAKGWIYVGNETDEYNQPLDPLVTDRYLFN